ncbi:MAG: holo-ACP synthase [Gallionella sp.]
MIFGIGTDIVECHRFESIWARHGIRLAERVLSPDELADYRSYSDMPRFLAKRFAAKEAFAKAVGSGLRSPVSLRRISVTRNEWGKPAFRFDEVLSRHLDQLGVKRHHLSVSDESSVIVAFVVLEQC